MTSGNSSSGTSEAEWEDVESNGREAAILEDLPVLATSPSSNSSAQPLEIVVSKAEQGKKRKKRSFFEKAFNAHKKKERITFHKVHLLCLVASARLRSHHCDTDELQALLLSLTPSMFVVMDLTDLCDEKTLLNLLRWFQSVLVKIKQCIFESCGTSHSSTHLLVALLRALGVRTRLVLALDPYPLKEPTQKVVKKVISTQHKNTNSEQQKSGSEQVSTNEHEGCSCVNDQLTSMKKSSQGRQKTMVTAPLKRVKGMKSMVKGEREGYEQMSKSCFFEPGQFSSGDEKHSQEESGLSKQTRAKRKGKRASIAGKLASLSVDDSHTESESYFTQDQPITLTASKPKKRRSKRIETWETQNSGDSLPQSKKRKKSALEDDWQDNTGETSRINEAPCLLKMDKEETGPQFVGNDSLPLTKTLTYNQPSTAKGPEGCNHSTHVRVNLESEEDTFKKDPRFFCEGETSTWAEVLVNSGKWRSLHLPSLSLGHPQLCEKHCGTELSYVIAVENDSRVVDVTARYAYRWCTHTHKIRVDAEWWGETLRPFKPPVDEVDMEEEDIKDQLMSYPLPVGLQDYKNHPLYALKRHLLKFEAIYPPDCQILGYFKNEPIYPRDCVHLLHTRESWLKEGRVIKAGEKPYNVVKGRKKRGQTQLEAHNNLAEVFGKWQTDQYVPLPVVYGQVPKNEYGNIELFQPSMLPQGAVHLTVPAISKVARKLGIDFAPAMMGWDFHSGYCHPIIDGIVVAKEWEMLLLEAWQQEQEVVIDKQQQKRETRLISQWVRLTRGLLIRERVRQRFSQHFEDTLMLT